MDLVILVVLCIYLFLKVLILKISLEALIGYMVDKKYTIPPEEDWQRWRVWSAKNLIGIRIDQKDRI